MIERARSSPADVNHDQGVRTDHKSIGHDRLTVAALGLLAMCMVTCNHEALGHGSACMVFGGHIRILTSSVFHCDLPSPWIDFAGPATNFTLGSLALVIRVWLPLPPIKMRLFLIFVTGFSYFWEGGYLIHAMHRRDGDLYSFAHSILGDVSTGERWGFALLGLAIYMFGVRITALGLSSISPSAGAARSAARVAWVAATLGALAAGILGAKYGGLRDATMEVGLASFPLLFIPRANRCRPDASPVPVIRRSFPIITAALIIFGLFAVTLGRGVS